ncbi:LytTR family DNA-binding domain-containing protein [Herbivorax sp. ANBcel31]|uniref:LytTR family DNA-binding domain-containing protein n=1 Tax=Herbivorax sp. ANBcel31 TaxID=3069754 RepID=UPI0027B1C642|nr:LytTR family DNA-binding domain-containing protein [Herbivorax sp. ANBcel31]MDQ2086468.1 LytTR family DNA-binding domain-containing protein [Herbivorax sp. ANBcel31]
MQVEIKIDESCDKPKIVIYTKEITREVTELANRLSNNSSKVITGVKDEKIYLLNPEKIYRFYSEDKKVYADCVGGIYIVKMRLYEIEDIFANSSFIRISNSAIVNFDKVSNLDVAFASSITLKFNNGKTEFVSRRYIKKIKQYLGL